MHRTEVNAATGVVTRVELTEQDIAAAAAIASSQPIPLAICTPWQIRKALNQVGLRQQVEDYIAASNDQTLKDGWEFATHIRSDDQFVLMLGSALNKTVDEIREFILWSSTL